MLIAPLAVSLLALFSSITLVLVARREAEAIRGALAALSKAVNEATQGVHRARGQAEQARGETVSTRQAVTAMQEAIREIHKETCGPITLRPIQQRAPEHHPATEAPEAYGSCGKEPSARVGPQPGTRQ